MNSNHSDPKRILIVKTSSLGDIIHVFPVLNYLKLRFPSVQIDWIVEKQFAELVRAHPLVNQTLCVETKKWRKGWLKKETLQAIKAFRNQIRQQQYDIVFDLQGNIKSGLITSQAISSHKVGFAKKSVPEWPNCLFTHHRFNPAPAQNIRQDYLSIVMSYFNDATRWNWDENSEVNMHVSSEISNKLAQILQQPQLTARKKVLVCPGSAWRNKQMNVMALGNLLSHFHDQLNSSLLLVWGNEEEKQLAQQLQSQFAAHAIVIERLPLPGLQNLMAQMDLVIAMDSLPLHLAGTTQTPTYSIFGASLADKYKPIGSRHLAYQGTCPYGRTFEKRCPILRTCPTGACIQNRTGDELFEYYVSKR